VSKIVILFGRKRKKKEKKKKKKENQNQNPNPNSSINQTLLITLYEEKGTRFSSLYL
jgi:hypothetical protein